jgi:RimJ/RimL family protein N-acetyltransferase
MKLVNCDSNYWEFIRELRTNEKNSIWFYTQPEITTEEQKNYMNKNAHKYKICLLEDVPVGYIGIINENEITYCVKPNYKNMGIGTFMVQEFMKLYENLVAYVLPENQSSCKVFEKLGFEKHIHYKYNKK